MRLSAPIYRLKRRARLLSRDRKLALHQALDRVARDEGFASWSLLVAKARGAGPAQRLFSALRPGDLALIGARPGHGKTLLALELIAEANGAGASGVFFTLEYNFPDVERVLRQSGRDSPLPSDLFVFDNDERITADYMIRRLETARPETIVVIDYLQLLDRRRETPELSAQVRALKQFAENRDLVIVALSQIDRAFELSGRSCPDARDVRLPNALDLNLFSVGCFLHDGEVRMARAG